jgi:hypothetical protein
LGPFLPHREVDDVNFINIKHGESAKVAKDTVEGDKLAAIRSNFQRHFRLLEAGEIIECEKEEIIDEVGSLFGSLSRRRTNEVFTASQRTRGMNGR